MESHMTLHDVDEGPLSWDAKKLRQKKLTFIVWDQVSAVPISHVR